MHPEGPRHLLEHQAVDSPVSLEMTPEEEHALKRRLRVVHIEPGFAAEEAGLQLDDFITHIGGEPVTHDVGFTCRDTQPIELTVERAGETMSMTVIPTFNKKADRHVLGISFLEELTNPEYRRESFENDGERMERSYRRIESNIPGGPAMNICVDMSADPTVVYERIIRKSPGSSIPQKVRRVTSFIARSDSGRQCDVLREFASNGSRMYMSEERLAHCSGWHSKTDNHIVFSDLTSVSSLRTFFHELRHVEQVGEKWERVMEQYGVEYSYDERNNWSPKNIRALLGTIDSILHAVPRAADDIDMEKVKVDLEPSLARLSEEEARLRSCIAEQAGAIHELLRKNRPDILGRMRELFQESVQFGSKNKTVSPEDFDQLRAALQEIGISLAPDSEEGVADNNYLPLLVDELSSPNARRDLPYMLFENISTRVITLSQDEATPNTTVRLGFKWGAIKDPRYVDIQCTAKKEDFAEAKKTVDDLKREMEEVEKRIFDLKLGILDYELRDGVFLLDILALPTRMSERDADAGAFQALRKLREKIGVDFSREPMARFDSKSYMERLGAYSPVMRRVVPPKNGQVAMSV